MADILHACTICHAVAAEPAVVYERSTSERFSPGWRCHNTSSCRRRLHRRLQQADAAYHAIHGETLNAGRTECCECCGRPGKPRLTGIDARSWVHQQVGVVPTVVCRVGV